MENRKQINKVTVLGAQGMLGYAAVKYYRSKGYNVEGIDRKKFDVLRDNITVLKKHLVGSSFVLNCIGIIKPRIAAMSVEDVLSINGIFPKNLAKLCKTLDIPCFHITTDCVYSGSKGNYSETDLFDINDLYGLSKNAGENTECMTIRTSIIGEEIKNKYSLIEWARSQKGKTVSGFTNHKWNGITTLYMAQIIEEIYQLGEYKEGIYHLHSPNIVTKAELLKILNSVYKLDLTINNTVAPQKVDRSLKTINPLSKKIVSMSIQNQIKQMKNFFHNQS